MLDTKLICEINESNKKGDEIAREFKELECSIEQGKMDMWELFDKLGELCLREKEWKNNHKKLLLTAYTGVNGN